jgi:hypothetical protein
MIRTFFIGPCREWLFVGSYGMGLGIETKKETRQFGADTPGAVWNCRPVRIVRVEKSQESVLEVTVAVEQSA